MSERTVIIYDVNTDTQYYFGAQTPYEAMTKMLYCENVKALDKSADIRLTQYGLLLKHRGGEFWAKR